MKFLKGVIEMLGKIFGICKDKSMVETYSKEQIDEIVANIDTVIEDGEITTEKLADGAVTADKIDEYAITNEKLGLSCVGASNIERGAIAPMHIFNGAVTHEKLDEYAVFKTGSYVGTGANQTIDVGFKPKWVILLSSDGWRFDLTENFTAFMGYDVDNKEVSSGAMQPTNITSNGFKVDTTEMKAENVQFDYIAFR